MEVTDTVKIITPAVIAFATGISITPFITYYLYQFRVWKKNPGKNALDGTEASEFNKIHKERERNVPRMGGLVILGSACITISVMWLISQLFPATATMKMDFLSRSQTWIPLFALLFGGTIGFVNDAYEVWGHGRGLRLRTRLVIVTALALFLGWWFYDKLDIVAVQIPFGGELFLGWLIIPLFLVVTLSVYASGIIDGIDGLSGGVFAPIFASYAIIAAAQGQIDLAAFSAMIVGALLSYLWFNIPPARFFMTEIGSMALTLCLATIVFMTDSLGGGIGISVLPITGALLVATVGSVLIQIISKKLFGKKVFLSAPLHHHFEAKGWPSYKITMRYWVLALIFAVLGIIVALLG